MILMLVLAIGATSVNAQDAIVQDFIKEMKIISQKRDALWKSDNSISGGFDDSNAKLYIQYSLEACTLVDKNINYFTDGNEQIDLLWMQVDILSDALDVYNKNKVGLTVSEYETQFRRMVAALNHILSISNQIDDIQANLQVQFDVKRELGNQYFKHNKYQMAFDNYKSCIKIYQKYMDSYDTYDTDEDICKLGQEAYYYLGYSAYKLGDTATANYYLNKAKSILNDELIQPYK